MMEAVDNPSYFSLPADASKKLRSPSSCKWLECRVRPAFSSTTKIKRNTSSQMQCAIQSLNRTRSEDRHWFILGKPRPEDISPSLNKFSGRYHHQRHNSTGSMNRSYNVLHQDMVHCGDEGDPVLFAGGTNTQYYKTAAVPPNRTFCAQRRRHSMESFLNRDKIFMHGSENEAKNRNVQSKVGTFKETKMLTKTARGDSKMGSDELDILLVSCGENESATLWVNYLISCFQQISKEQNNPTLRLQNIKLEDTLSPSTGTESLSEQCSSAHLRIIVICPLFLQKVVSATSIKESILTKILRPERMLVLISGLQDHAESRLKDVFPEYNQWRKMRMRDKDPTFDVGDFLGVSMDILSRSRHLREEINQEEGESSVFSIYPKKTTVNQNKLLILLTEALAADDVVKVFVFRNHHRTEITNAKRRNPYAIQLTMPACCFQVSVLVKVQVEKNGKSLGHRMVKCESKMRELEQLILSLDNPIHFLCQCFGLNTRNKDQLDTFLLQCFQKNMPRNFNVLGSISLPFEGYIICNEEYPTLLHFSAKYGLEKLTLKLLESPGGNKACRIRNISHYTPAEMAETANHGKLANILRRHKETTEFSRIRDDCNRISKNEPEFAACDYLSPKPLDDTYLIPPNARPVDIHVASPTGRILPQLPCYANFKHCDFPLFHTTSNVSTSASSPILTSALENYDVPLSGLPYTPPIPSTPHSPVEYEMKSYSDLSFTGSDLTYSNSFDAQTSYSEIPSEKLRSLSRSKRASTVSDPYQSSEYSTSSTHQLSPDDELLEIIKDFKSNVYTISEAEMIVQQWQNRSDVQKFFRDQKEQLTEMREEYDRVQREMTADQMKRTNLFNRMCKLFSHQSKRKQPVKSKKSQKSKITETAENRRPSNLNLRSSSSDCLEVNSNGNRSHENQYVPVVGPNVGKLYPSIEKPITSEWRTRARSHQFPQPSIFLRSSATSEDSHRCARSDCPTSSEVDPDRRNSDEPERSEAVQEYTSECEEGETIESSIRRPSSENKEEKRIIFFHSPSARTAQMYKLHKTNSLQLNSKLEYECGTRQSRVKSAESILVDRANNFSEAEKNAPRKYQIHSYRSLSLDYEPLGERSACADGLCTETSKRFSSQIADASSPTVGGDNNESTANEINFISSSDCESNDDGSLSWRSSSPRLDLSSLSLRTDSNGAFDENDEIDDFVEGSETDSFHLNIFEEEDIETETAPSFVRAASQPNYINICNLGFSEYVNVAIV